MQQLLESRKEDLKRICQDMKVQRLYAFGSVVCDHFREENPAFLKKETKKTP